jgi:hypothetical protein
MGEWSQYSGNVTPRNPDERRVLQMMFDPYLWGPEEEFAIVREKIALVPSKKTKDLLLVNLDSAGITSVSIDQDLLIGIIRILRIPFELQYQSEDYGRLHRSKGGPPIMGAVLDDRMRARLEAKIRKHRMFPSATAFRRTAFLNIVTNYQR